MGIGVVRVGVPHRRVVVWVRVRLARRVVGAVRVLVVFVVNMRVVVVHFFMRVFVVMRFGQVQPDAQAHQRARRREGPRHALAKHQKRHGRADERGRREVRPGPGRAEVPQGQDEAHQADPFAFSR